MKNVQIQRIFWSVFSCIWTEFGDLRSNIQSEYRKIWTRKTSLLDIYFPISRSVYEGHEDHLCFNNETKGTDCPFRQGYSTNIITTKYMGYYHSEWQLRMANWDKVNIRISSIHKELINSATDKKTPEPFLSKRNFKVK